MIASDGRQPLVTICIPHWQVREMIAICLRSIEQHSSRHPIEVMVVDNGSRDESLAYLRSLGWIRLIERPEEGPANWPANVFTAWDLGAREARGEFFLTMHSDVFVKRDDWLDPLLRQLGDPRVAAAGAWKFALEHPLYALQKRVVGNAVAGLKRLFGRRVRSSWREGHYPRDYCALYRRSVLLEHNLTFCPTADEITGGYPIARQLWSCGFETRVIPVREMAERIVHMTHGTASVSGKRLRHESAQRKAERRARALFSEHWVQSLRESAAVDVA